MSRAIDLRLKPSDASDSGAELGVYTYAREPSLPRAMAEAVYLQLDVARCHFCVELTSDEARVLANQLLQVADVADEQRAARVADDDLQASFDEISQELHEHDGRTGVYYAHPDVHYVPADQVESKVQELNEAGVKRFMVLIDPSAEAAA